MRVPLKIAMVATLLVVVSASSSWALIEQYLPGGTDIVMKFTNWDEGTLYDESAIVAGHTYLHAGDPGYDPLYDLDVLRASGGTSLPTKGATGEDSWGIFKLKEISNAVTDQLLWSTDWSASDSRWVTSPFEITMLFWGEYDDSLYFDGTTQFIKGSGLQFAMFEDTARNFDFSGGPALRAGLIYPTVTDGAMFWTGNAVTGDPKAGTSEFYTEFTPGPGTTHDTGKGEFFAQAGTTDAGTGSLNGLLADLGGGIEFKFQFTADSLGASPWDLKSQDPVTAEITPELSTPTLMLLGLVPMGLAWWRRKRD